MNRDDIKAAVGEALDEKLGSFFIEREQHYQDHMFVQGVRQNAEQVKKAGFWAIGIGIVGTMVLGIAAWVMSVVKGG